MTDIDTKYKNGKIYKLVSSLTADVYVGSTILKLNRRLSHHKSHYKLFIENEFRDCASFRLFEKGKNEVRIELIEDYSCNCKSELEIRERYWIENTVNCINKKIPTRTVKEYRQAHKEAISEREKEYRKANREVILERKKEYRQANKQVLLERKKVKIACECGSVIRKNDLSRHKKTIKHTNYIAIQLTNNITQLTI